MHPDLLLPEDARIIWRYMELWKFRLMIQKKSIFFSRADKQTDKLEGEYPEGMLTMLTKLKRRSPEGIPSDDGNTYTFSEWHTQKEIRSRLLSCWNLSLSESRKMWTTYTQCRNSIAIRSTIEKLKNCFHDRVEPVVWIGKVRYGKEENRLPNSISTRNVDFFLYPFFAKKDAYRWEKEVRATVNIALVRQEKFDHNPYGCYIKANLKILVDSVWINPHAPKELRSQVGTLLNSCGLGNIKIRQSSWDSLA